MIRNKVFVKLNGLNQNYFLQECIKHKIALKDYKRKAKDSSSFVVLVSDYEKIKRLDILRYYKTHEKLVGGVNYWLLKLPRRIGLFAGMLIAFLFVFFASQRVLKINILAFDATQRDEIAQMLKEKNITIGCYWNEISTKELESQIFNSIKSATNVSVKRDGSCLSISCSKSANSAVRHSPVVAPEDCIIEEIEVARGAAKFSKGDLVRKGQMIVETNSSGELVSSVKVRVYHQSSVAVSQFLLSTERSGKTEQKTKIIWPFQNQSFDFSCTFKQFEKEIITTNCFDNFLLPIKKVTVIYHELKQIKISEDVALDKAKTKAKALIEKELKCIDKISFEEREQNGQKFVDCFAEAVLEL